MGGVMLLHDVIKVTVKVSKRGVSLIVILVSFILALIVIALLFNSITDFEVS